MVLNVAHGTDRVLTTC